MYAIDGLDEVMSLKGLPQSSVGAPCPLVLSNEHTIVLAYYVQEQVDPKWEGTTVHVVNQNTTEDLVSMVTFEHYWSMMFGPPNDEAFEGHPLYARGLRPYSSFEIKNSSWIRILEQMNSVHPSHNRDFFTGLQCDFFTGLHHYILTFHDSTFECVARNINVQVLEGPISHVISEMQNKLWL